jgi:hypothetical protein
LFIPLQNKCFIQLCGRPVFTLPTLACLEEAERKRKRKEEKGSGRSGSGKRRKVKHPTGEATTHKGRVEPVHAAGNTARYTGCVAGHHSVFLDYMLKQRDYAILQQVTNRDQDSTPAHVLRIVEL